MIPNINNKMDLGKYQGEVETEHGYKKQAIEIKEIIGQSFICLYYLSDL